MNDTQVAPAIVVIFGITGDLSQRKLLPALYHLLKDGLLDEHTRIVGVSRRDMNVNELLDKTELCVIESDNVCDPAVIAKLKARIHMFKMNLESGDSYDALHTYLDSIEDKVGMCMNRLYYLSIPPSVYAPIVAHLGSHGLNESCQHNSASTRILIEKPFGYDLASAEDLIKETGRYFSETQVFRIDHYLAKETVQNILTFRFHNPVFEALWNREHIAHIDIMASEKIDIEGRTIFYEQVGAMRDFIQSHLMQLLAVTTMEEPKAMTGKAIHTAKLALLEAITPIAPNEVSTQTVRGQYASYADEVGNTRSTTETFAAIRLSIQNDRWEGVPITIRTGKALKDKKTEITVTFKHTDRETHHPNILTFSVQPHEGISIGLYVKRPGFDNQLQHVPMDFSYARSFDDHGHPDAYERVLVDAIKGDRTLFATSDEVLASWRILESIIETWGRSPEGMQIYKKHSNGPTLPKSFGHLET